MAGHAASKRSFENWVTAVKFADWEIPEDIQQTFCTADLLGNSTNRVIFDVGGNTYRMICKYHFGITKVRLFVCWIGTHSEYDELCAHGDQYSVFEY